MKNTWIHLLPKLYKRCIKCNPGFELGSTRPFSSMIIKGITVKVNIRARLKFELVYYNIKFQHVNHYAT